MAWDDDGIVLLRALINDSDATAYRYTDTRLTEALLVAAFQVNLEIDFLNDYVISLGNETITPDPTNINTKDDNFLNLIAVKAACIIDRGSAGTAADQAIMVQDGSSRIDLREAFKAKLSLLQKGWCAVYDNMKQEYITSQQGVIVGAAIMTPFRIYAGTIGDRPFIYNWTRR